MCTRATNERTRKRTRKWIFLVITSFPDSRQFFSWFLNFAALKGLNSILWYLLFRYGTFIPFDCLSSPLSCQHPYIFFLIILKTNRKTSGFLFSFTTDLSRNIPHLIFSLRSPFDESSATYHNLICNNFLTIRLKRNEAKRILESFSCTFDTLWFQCNRI